MRRARLEEAEAFVKESQRAAGSEDIFSQVLLRSVLSKVTAREGRPDEAERIVREAVAIAKSSDSLLLQGEALTSLAHVLGVAGRTIEGGAALTEALDVCERKGNVGGQARARHLWETSRRLL